MARFLTECPALHPANPNGDYLEITWLEPTGRHKRPRTQAQTCTMCRPEWYELCMAGGLWVIRRHKVAGQHQVAGDRIIQTRETEFMREKDAYALWSDIVYGRAR